MTPTPRIEVNGASSKFEVDTEGVQRALTALSLSGVRIDIWPWADSHPLGDCADDNAEWGGGGYCFNKGQHTVLLDSALDPVEASQTIWHELTHAWQSEHLFERDGSAVAARASTPESTYELVAQMMETCHNDIELTIPLCEECGDYLSAGYCESPACDR